jgi:hypothetical protein
MNISGGSLPNRSPSTKNNRPTLYQKTRLTLHGWRNSSANPVTYHVIHVYPRDLAKPAQAEKK